MSKLIGAKLGDTAYLSVTDDGKLQYSLTGEAGDFVEFETSGGGGGGESSGIKFYECKTYTPDADAYTKYFFTMSGAPIADANTTYERTKWVETPDTDSDYTTTAQWTASNGYKIIEESGYGEFSYYIKNASGTNVYSTDTPLSARATDYSTIPWMDMDMYESVTLTFSAISTEDIPATTEGWTGVLMQQDANTGAWSASATDPVDLTVQYLTPRVGEIYSEDTSIRVRQMFDGSTLDYAVYLPLDSFITEAPTGQTVTTVGDPVFTTTGGVECMSLDGSSGLQIPDTDIDFGGDLTVACKVRYDDLNDGVLFHIGTAQANDLLIMNSGSTQWITGTAGSGGQIVRVSSTINTGTWYEIAVVVSNGQLSFYQDGTLLDTASWNIVLERNGNIRIGFGIWNGSNTWFFTGQLAQFMIFNRALSAEEIGQIFE